LNLAYLTQRFGSWLYGVFNLTACRIFGLGLAFAHRVDFDLDRFQLRLNCSAYNRGIIKCQDMGTKQAG